LRRATPKSEKVAEVVEDYERDIEDSEDELDAPDEDALGFWAKKQRELVTSVVDYNLGTLTTLISDGAIDLSPRYQRRCRWDNTRKSKLIESFLMNVPVPPVFLNEDMYGTYSVIDGKQRLTAIYEFFTDTLKLSGLQIFGDINGLYFRQLPMRLQSVLKTRPNLRAVIILRQSDQDVKFEVFQRLNSGGIRLNPQEIRNSAYPGKMNDLILSLSDCQEFHAILGIKDKDKSAIYQEMRDAEFVLRFLTFRNRWSQLRGGMKHSMDKYMADNQKPSDSVLTKAKSDFLQTVAAVNAAFGQYAFRRWVPETKTWRRQVLAALYDAEMFACRGMDPEPLAANRGHIVEALKELFSDSEFRKAIDAATNSPSHFRRRIEIVQSMLRSITGGE